MKKILTCLIIGLLILLTSDLNARNRINYHPKTFIHLEDSLGNNKAWEAWISSRLDSTVVAATPEILNNIFANYSKLFTDFRWRPLDLRVARQRMFFFRDSVTVAADDTVVTNWMDKNRTYIIYANLQEFTEQNVVSSSSPPGTLGFFEYVFSFRIAVPYPGSYKLYEYILAHESAHAWMHQLMRESVKVHNKKMSQIKAVRYRIIGQDERFSMPLWSTEGFAEWCAQKYSNIPPIYMTIMKDIYRRNQTTDLTKGVPKIALDMGFDVYSWGFSFFNWLESKYGKEKIIEFFAQRPHYSTRNPENNTGNFKNSFDMAWEKTFGQSVPEMAIDWAETLLPYFEPYFTDTLKSTTEKVAWPINRNKGERDPLLVGYVSHDKGKVAFYTLDPEFAARVEVRDLFTNETWIVHQMFKNKSLYYRFGSAPVIKGNKVAVIINKEGQDELHIYELRKQDLIKKGKLDKILWGQEKTDHVKQTALLRKKDIFTINTPSFNHDGTKLVFEGIAPNGFSDLYIWNLKTDAVERLTNDIYQDLNPRFTNNNETIIFVSDRIDATKMDVFAFWLSTNEITYLYRSDQSNTAIDQIAVSPDNNLVAVRMVSADHSPQVLIWKPPHNVYHVFSTFYGISQIVDWIDNNTLMLLDSRFKLVKFHVKNLESYTQTSAPTISLEDTTWQPTQPDTLIKPTPVEKKYRYPMPLGLSALGLATATGEEVYLSSNIYIGYQSGFGLLYGFSMGRIDMRKRLRKFYGFTASRNFNIRTLENSELYYNLRLHQYTRYDWVRDHDIRLNANFYLPIDLENGIGFSASVGWLKRDYEFVFPYYQYYYSLTNTLNHRHSKSLPHQKPLNPKAQKYFKTTTSMALYHGWSLNSIVSVIKTAGSGALLGTGAYFIHDATFSNMYGEVNRGSWLSTQLDVAAVNRKLLEGQFLFDGRLYIQLKGRILLANRLYVIKSLGSDRQVFWIDPIFKKPRFPYYNIRLGTDLAVRQIELRFPILNFIAFQPALMPIGSPEYFGFWVNGALFYYSGNIWFHRAKMPQMKRAGLAIKLRISGNVSLQYEQYKMKYGYGSWGKWERGWFLNFEF